MPAANSCTKSVQGHLRFPVFFPCWACLILCIWLCVCAFCFSAACSLRSKYLSQTRRRGPARRTLGRTLRSARGRGHGISSRIFVVNLLRRRPRRRCKAWRFWSPNWRWVQLGVASLLCTVRLGCQDQFASPELVPLFVFCSFFFGVPFIFQ